MILSLKAFADDTDILSAWKGDNITTLLFLVSMH
jgi:hypothetical protein